MAILGEVIGWVSAVAFALCAVPQAVMSYQQKHSNGVSGLFLALWLVGEVAGIAYIFLQPTMLYPILANYVFNGLSLVVIIYYKMLPVSKNVTSG